ncbi:hypothetical protein [Aliikangiella sp. IMCC44632]
MVNIGEVSKPSGGVTPLKTKSNSRSVNSVDAPEHVIASNKDNQKNSQSQQNEAQQQKKPPKQPVTSKQDELKQDKTLSKKNAKVDSALETAIPPDDTYDESGHKKRANHIDIKV